MIAMSRDIEFGPNGRIIQSIDSMEECRHLIYGVCTNPDSDQCCDFPHPEYCIYRCRHFTKEDGITPD